MNILPHVEWGKTVERSVCVLRIFPLNHDLGLEMDQVTGAGKTPQDRLPGDTDTIRQVCVRPHDTNSIP